MLLFPRSEFSADLYIIEAAGTLIGTVCQEAN